MTESETLASNPTLAPESPAPNPTETADIHRASHTQTSGGRKVVSRRAVSRASSGWSGLIALLVGLSLILGGFFPQLGFVLDTIQNFEWQLSIFLVLLALYQAYRRRWIWMSVTAAIALIPLLSMASLYIPASQPPPGNKIIRILSLNVESINTNYDAVGELITDVDADIVSLVECRNPWRTRIETALKGYPHVSVDEMGYSSGNVIYSKIPFQQKNRKYKKSKPLSLSMGIGEIAIDDHTILLMNIHAMSPTSTFRWQDREHQLWELGQFVQIFTPSHHLIVCGDFNATTRSHAIRQFISETRLRDSRQGFGMQNSWPTKYWPLRICIDHVFVSQDVHVHHRSVERDVGSDHFPVVVEVSFSPESTDPP